MTVEPDPTTPLMHLNTHPGQEMNYVLEGRLLIELNGKQIELNPGDSLYFDSSLPHGMKALDGKTVRFLAIILYRLPSQESVRMKTTSARLHLSPGAHRHGVLLAQPEREQPPSHHRRHGMGKGRVGEALRADDRGGEHLRVRP